MENHVEGFEDLKLLLDYEEKEREEIAQNFHREKSGLALASMFLGTVIKDATTGKVKVKSVEEVRLLLDNAIDALQKISAEIYPSKINIYGFIMPLKKFIRESIFQHKIQIEYSTLIIDPLREESIKEVAIFRISKNIINYLINVNCKSMIVEILLRGEKLEMTIKGNSVKENHSSSQEQSLQIIRARLIWQQAVILPETNWKDSFKVLFTVKNQKESPDL